MSNSTSLYVYPGVAEAMNRLGIFEDFPSKKEAIQQIVLDVVENPEEIQPFLSIVPRNSVDTDAIRCHPDLKKVIDNLIYRKTLKIPRIIVFNAILLTYLSKSPQISGNLENLSLDAA